MKIYLKAFYSNSTLNFFWFSPSSYLKHKCYLLAQQSYSLGVLIVVLSCFSD